MIKKYLDFINESLEFLLESNVVYSKKFREVMNKIEHPLAKKIIDIETDDENYPVRNNYLDVNLKENDKLGFIPDRKAQEILNDTKVYVNLSTSSGWLKHKEVNQGLFDKLGYTYEEGTTPYSAPSTEVGVVIAEVISDKSGKKYAWVKFPGGQGVYNTEKLRIVDNKENALWTKNRQEIYVGRGIRALLNSAGIKFTDDELGDFVNIYKKTVDKMNDIYQYFDVVSGEDIGHWYNYTNYKERRGTLGSSCMSNVPKRYFDIYMSNTDVCSLIILKSIEDEKLIMGRALLWTLSDGKKFVDRIYTINDSDVGLFRDYAKENGWYVKYYNSSSDSGRVIDPKTGDMIDLGTITVNIRTGEYDGYPYLDTLKYFIPSKGTLSNEGSSDSYSLESTNGDLWRCEYCDGHGNQTCGNCDGDGWWDCNRCSGSGERECGECSGSGKVEGEEGEEECSECGGSGNNECSYCDGSGREDCEDCSGRGQHSCYECQ
jgi:hypothetical protein